MSAPVDHILNLLTVQCALAHPCGHTACLTLQRAVLLQCRDAEMHNMNLRATEWNRVTMCACMADGAAQCKALEPRCSPRQWRLWNRCTIAWTPFAWARQYEAPMDGVYTCECSLEILGHHHGKAGGWIPSEATASMRLQ